MHGATQRQQQEALNEEGQSHTVCFPRKVKVAAQPPCLHTDKRTGTYTHAHVSLTVGLVDWGDAKAGDRLLDDVLVPLAVHSRAVRGNGVEPACVVVAVVLELKVQRQAKKQGISCYT